MLIEANDDALAELADGNAPNLLKLAEGGLEAPEVLQMLRSLAISVRKDFEPAAWLIVEDGEIVGLCSLKNAPDSRSAVEIGYGIAPSCRGRGAGRRAIAELVSWARSEVRVKCILVETSVDNIPSQRVLERNGFVRTGSRTDAVDGDLVCWQILVDQ